MADIYLYSVPTDASAADVRLRDPTTAAGGGGPIAYSLSGAAGTYTLTGQSATLTYSRTLSGAAGTYSLTGQAATFKVGHTLSGAVGAYTITGQAATLRVARALSGAAGSYSLTGQAATLTYTPGTPASTAYSLSGAAGAYTVAGQSATLTVARSLTGAAGSYALTGFDGLFGYVDGGAPVAYELSGEAGAYVITGGDATFEGPPPRRAAGGGGGRRQPLKRFVYQTKRKEAVAEVAKTEDDIPQLVALLEKARQQQVEAEIQAELAQTHQQLQVALEVWNFAIEQEKRVMLTLEEIDMAIIAAEFA